MEADAIPRMPIAPDGLLPPLPVLCAWLEEVAGDTIRLDALPADNAVLPACCAPYGIRRALLGSLPDGLPPAFRWRGSDGSELTVVADGAEAEAEDPLPLLAGRLPATAGRRRSTRRAYAELLAATRLAHAATVVGGTRQGDASSWDQLLAGLEGAVVAAPPALAALQSLPRDHGSLTVWNPAPLRRDRPLVLDARDTDLPWSLRDETGRRHAVQVVEGPLGRQLLSVIPMAELSCCRLHLDDRPAGELPWEVSARVLDNGLLRAEFAADGALIRLCTEGRFARLPQPLLSALPLTLQTAAQVLEDGPVRARLLFTYGDEDSGILRVLLGLQAGTTLLDIVWTWIGDGEGPAFALPVQDGDQLRLWQQGGPPRLVQAGEGSAESMHRFDGIRMLQMSSADGSEAGLDLSGLGGAAVTVAGDRLLVEADGELRVLLGHGTAPGDLAQADSWQRCEARVAPLDGDRPAPLFSDDPSALQALWSHRDAEGTLRLLLAERRGRHGTMLLHLAQGGAELLVDGAWQELPADREAGWWRLDFAPGAILPIRSR